MVERVWCELRTRSGAVVRYREFDTHERRAGLRPARTGSDSFWSERSGHCSLWRRDRRSTDRSVSATETCAHGLAVDFHLLCVILFRGVIVFVGAAGVAAHGGLRVRLAAGFGYRASQVFGVARLEMQAGDAVGDDFPHSAEPGADDRGAAGQGFG